jgi:hypothetical protein
MTESANRSKNAFVVAARLADFALVATLLFLTFQLAFAFQLHRPWLVKLVLATTIACLVIAYWFAGRAVRINVALIVVPLISVLLAYEGYTAYRRPRDGTAAWLAGRPFDSRGLWESLDAERRRDPSAVSYVLPRVLLSHQLVLPHWEPEARTISDNWGIVVGGARTLPLGGISLRRTVFNNESGTRIIYDSDEHGFNNPRGIWGSTGIQIAILGDSFSHGAGVAPEATTAARIRERYPLTLNLGMGANGPLMEYAGLREYLRYLEDDGFRQHLVAQQKEIDHALEVYLANLERSAPARWPNAFADAGITREVTPLWLQDLITTEQHSSLAGFLRLDASLWFLSKRFLELDPLEQPPDYRLFERILTKARDTVASWDGQLYFVYLPAVNFLDQSHREVPGRAPLLKLLQRLGIPLIDVHAAFLAEPDPQRFRFHYLSHATEAGYALHAETILRSLEITASTGADADPPLSLP